MFAGWTPRAPTGSRSVLGTRKATPSQLFYMNKSFYRIATTIIYIKLGIKLLKTKSVKLQGRIETRVLQHNINETTIRTQAYCQTKKETKRGELQFQVPSEVVSSVK